MARVFIDSFETRSLDFWDTNIGATIVSTAGLDMKNSYCLRNNYNQFIYKFLPESSEYCVALRFRMTHTTIGSVIEFYHGGTRLIRIWNGTTLYYQIGTGGATPGATPLATSTTYFLQVYIKIANSGGRIYSKINNALDYDYTGDTQPGSDTTIDRIRFGDCNYYDNIVIDDSAMPEETEICLLKPNGIGNSSSWTPTSGDNYTCVDEVPYSDADYVSEDVADAIDTYTIDNSPADLVTVKCIQVQARARKDNDSLLDNMNIVVRSDADYHGSDELLTTTFAEKTKVWETNPADSLPFEKTDIDALEIGVRART
jgi:hypothetical protein